MNPPLPRRAAFPRTSLVLGFGLAFALGAPRPAWGQALPKKIDFAHEIAPLLKARCAECHTNGKYKGSISFDTREDV